MAAICGYISKVGRNLASLQFSRNLFLSSTTRLREIVERQEGNTTVIEGVLYPDKKEHLLVKKAKSNACVLCALGLDVKHTDVLILSQFVRNDGCMLPARLTGLCTVQQRRVGIMVAMAQKAGLMPNLAPPNSKKDPQSRWGWRKYNTYYDETTIRQRYYT